MQITLTREEYKELEIARDNALHDCAELRQRLQEAQTNDPTEKLPQLLSCIHAALPIVKFAVGNLDPHTVRGWPYADLAALADGLERAPGATTDMLTSAHEFRSFIRDAQEIENGRAQRDAYHKAMQALEARSEALASWEPASQSPACSQAQVDGAEDCADADAVICTVCKKAKPRDHVGQCPNCGNESVCADCCLQHACCEA